MGIKKPGKSPNVTCIGLLVEWTNIYSHWSCWAQLVWDLHIYIHLYRSMHLYMYIYAYIHTYIYTYIQRPICWGKIKRPTFPIYRSFFHIPFSYTWAHAYVGRVRCGLCEHTFAKEPYKRDHVLQKRPTIVRSLLIVATWKKTYIPTKKNMKPTSAETHSWATAHFRKHQIRKSHQNRNQNPDRSSQASFQTAHLGKKKYELLSIHDSDLYSDNHLRSETWCFWEWVVWNWCFWEWAVWNWPIKRPAFPIYGVALVSRIDKIIGLFCKRAL